MAEVSWFVPLQVTLSLGLWVGSTSGPAECPQKTYLDPVTGSCKDCSSICKDARAHNTEDKCTFYCHDYNQTGCTHGFYFNAALNKCGSCTVLCSNGNDDPHCKKECSEVLTPNNAPKRLSTGMIVLIVFIVIGVLIFGIYGLVCLLRPGHRLSWRPSNPYRRPQTCPDEFDEPHSVVSSHDELEILEDQKEHVGFSDLKMTIQNPVT